MLKIQISIPTPTSKKLPDKTPQAPQHVIIFKFIILSNLPHRESRHRNSKAWSPFVVNLQNLFKGN